MGVTFKETLNGFTVNLYCESNLSFDEAYTLRQAVRHMASRLSSNEFKEFCINYAYEYKTSTGHLWWKQYHTHYVEGFKYSDGRNGLEIYNHLMNGSEKLSMGVSDQTANIHLMIDRRLRRGVLGYTYPNTTKQWIYSWFLKSDYRKIAGNLAHEWCHKMGYGHEYRYNQTRRHTVPYAVGDFVAS